MKKRAQVRGTSVRGSNRHVSILKHQLSFEQVVAVVELSPSLAFSIVRNRAWDAPRLAQVAIRTGKGVTAMAIRHAVMQEYTRTMGGGPTANYLFRSTLLLEGDGADQLQAEMRRLVARVDPMHPDRENGDLLVAPIETKDAVAKRASLDSAYGRLYANFFDAPEAAVEQLRREYNEHPQNFSGHIGHLAAMVLASPSSAEALVNAAARLEGVGAGPFKLRLLNNSTRRWGATSRS